MATNKNEYSDIYLLLFQTIAISTKIFGLVVHIFCKKKHDLPKMDEADQSFIDHSIKFERVNIRA